MIYDINQFEINQKHVIALYLILLRMLRHTGMQCY